MVSGTFCPGNFKQTDNIAKIRQVYVLIRMISATECFVRKDKIPNEGDIIISP